MRQIMNAHIALTLLIVGSTGIAGPNNPAAAPARILKGHTAWVRWLAFTPNGKVLVSGSWDRTVKSWDTKTGECISTLRVHDHSVNALAFSADASLIASAGADGHDGTRRSVKLWARETGKLQQTLAIACDKIALSSNGKMLAADFGGDNSIGLWATGTSKLQRRLSGFEGVVSTLTFGPRDDLVVAGTGNFVTNDRPARSGEFLLWDLSQSGFRHREDGYFLVNDVELCRDGRYLAVAATMRSQNRLQFELQIWRLGKTFEIVHRLGRPIIQDEVSDLTFSPTGDLIALVNGPVVRIVDARTGKPTAVLGDKRGQRLSAVAFSSDGKWIAAGGAGCSLQVWDTSVFFK